MAQLISLRARTSAAAVQPPPAKDRGDGAGVSGDSKARRFETLFAAHLDAAYDFARWLARNDRNAEDVVQEACLRAFKSIDTFRGDSGRAWLLAIVRNTYYSWFRKRQAQALDVPFDEDALSVDAMDMDDGSCSIEQVLQRADARRLVNEAIERLPEQFREVVVLRELEDLSYKEIAAVAAIPLGTVMSRLARARKLLLEHLRHAVTVD
jgi:RNA polymerase sigma-70 factor (ECF subfamily)